MDIASRREIKKRIVRLALIALAPAAVLCAAARFCHYFGLPLETLLRDPAAVTDTPYYVGALSNAGVLLWCVAAVTSLFAACVLRGLRGDVMERRLMLHAGALSAVLMLDDFFMLHESALPHLTGLPEKAVMACYAAWGMWLTWRFRQTIARRDGEIFIAAVLCLGMSVGMDVLPGAWLGMHEMVIEDGMKLSGIMFWAIYLALTARRMVLEASEPIPPRMRRLVGPLRRYTRGAQRERREAKRPRSSQND